MEQLGQIGDGKYVEEDDHFNPFAVSKAWLDTAAPFSLGLAESGLFHIPDLTLPSLEFKYSSIESLDPSNGPKIPELDVFDVGSLEHAIELPDVSITSTSESDSRSAAQSDAAGVDIWNLVCDLGPLKDDPKILTWESFFNTDHAEAGAQFISEAGSAAFDAALTLQAQRSKHVVQAGRMVQPDVLLRSLVLLAVGRSSVLFLHDTSSSKFYQAIDDSRMTGYSLDSCQDLIQEILELGNTILSLKLFTKQSYATDGACPSMIALASAVDTTISSLESELMKGSGRISTLLQLQDIVKGPKAMLHSLRDVVEDCSSTATNDQLLSRFYKKIQYFDECGQDVDVLLQIFKRVSAPWIEDTMGRMGVSIDLPRDAVDICRSDEKANAFESLQNQRTSAFLPGNLDQLTQDTEKCLQFVRNFHPDHPLANIHKSTAEAPCLEWALSLDDLSRISDKAQRYRDSIASAITAFDSGNPQASQNCLDRRSDSDSKPVTAMWPSFGCDNDFMVSIKTLSAAPELWASATRDDLHDLIVTKVLQKSDLDSPLSRLPVSSICRLSMSPLMTIQHDLVSTAALRSILSDHDLRLHLDLLHSFHLFGSGIFAANLTRVLFSADIEAAERTRGVVRTGIGNMGLKLGSGQRREWPPASSELTLALMNILRNSWHSQVGPWSHGIYRNRKLRDPIAQNLNIIESQAERLPGDLSFSIRSNVSQDEIEKILDPDSIFAIDFLRLSYTPPPALSELFTPSILEKYDRIFKLLLRMLRMQFVVGELSRDASISSRKLRHRNIHPAPVERNDTQYLTATFRHRATHLVATLTSYFLQVAIAPRHRALQHRLSALEARLNPPVPRDDMFPIPTQTSGAINADDTVLSLPHLARLHEETLDGMCAALFLRSRQRKAATALSAVLGDILAFAVILRDGRNGDGEGDWNAKLKSRYASFEAGLAAFKLSLERESDKAEDKTSHDSREGSANAARDLLAML